MGDAVKLIVKVILPAKYDKICIWSRSLDIRPITNLEETLLDPKCEKEVMDTLLEYEVKYKQELHQGCSTERYKQIEMALASIDAAKQVVRLYIEVKSPQGNF